VKAKMAEAKVEKGWSVAGDANAQTQLKEKIKTQDLKKVPPPTAGGNAAAAAGANASVSPSASLAPGMAPVEKGKHKGKAGGQIQPGTATSPITSPSVATSPGIAPEYGKPGKGKRAEKFGGTPPPTGPIASPEGIASPLGAPEYGKPSKGKRGEQFGGTPATGATPGPEGVTAPEGKRKGLERGYQPTPGGVSSPGENFNQPRGKQKQFEQQQPGMSPAGPQNTPSGQQSGGPYGEGRGKHKAEGVNALPTSGAQAPAGQPAEKKHEGKGKGATPTPGPQ
jgi:hypothetical protein